MLVHDSEPEEENDDDESVDDFFVDGDDFVRDALGRSSYEGSPLAAVNSMISRGRFQQVSIDQEGHDVRRKESMVLCLIPLCGSCFEGGLENPYIEWTRPTYQW